MPVPDLRSATGRQSTPCSPPGRRSEDEDLVAIVENDACGVDAIPWFPDARLAKET